MACALPHDSQENSVISFLYFLFLRHSLSVQIILSIISKDSFGFFFISRVFFFFSDSSFTGVGRGTQNRLTSAPSCVGTCIWSLFGRYILEYSHHFHISRSLTLEQNTDIVTFTFFPQREPSRLSIQQVPVSLRLLYLLLVLYRHLYHTFLTWSILYSNFLYFRQNILM